VTDNTDELTWTKLLVYAPFYTGAVAGAPTEHVPNRHNRLAPRIPAPLVSYRASASAPVPIFRILGVSASADHHASGQAHGVLSAS
jgi:hypothetical protein